MTAIDPRSPCIVGVGSHTWHPHDTAAQGAPEPLDMWVDVANAAAADSRGRDVANAAAADSRGRDVLDAVDSLNVVYCQTCQYDDPPARLAERLRIEPRHQYYSGIGGTTAQQLVSTAAEAILRGERDVVLVTSAEALATQRRAKRQGERIPYSFRPAEKRPFPWEAPMLPAEIAHEVFQAWLTFAVFDNARRAHMGASLTDYRRAIGEMMAPLSAIAACNPDAWFPTARTPGEIVTPTATNRMVGYPYTKYMVAVMDVDMAAALLVMSHERADTLGVPQDQRVYLRGWCYATDPVYVAEHREMWRSPAMAAAGQAALRAADAGIDDVAHLDLYSCFASSLNFARDALGLAADDGRALTVTGGLPYHGGPASGYMTHSIAQMARELRSDPGALGMVSGVGMTMTKHVFGVYSTTPAPTPVTPPDATAVQQRLDASRPVEIADRHAGEAQVAAYSVVHGRDGQPEWALLVCDVAGGRHAEGDDHDRGHDNDVAVRTYARSTDPELLVSAESEELVGRTVRLDPVEVELPMGPAVRNLARLGT